MEAQLQRLLDEREIQSVLHRYCRGVDRCDVDLIASCYHPDAVDDHGNWQASGAEAPNLIVDRVKPGRDAAMHFLGNVHVEVQDDDTAFSECYLLAFRSSGKDGRAAVRTRCLRFVDRFERRDGVWRIAERVVVDDWNRVDAVEPMPETDLFRYGAKDRTDPVYAIRRGRVARAPGGGT